MDIISLINPYKQKLVDVVRKNSTEEVVVYVKNTLNLMTKKIMTLDSVYTSNRLAIAIRNAYKFYKRYECEELGQYIACTLYFICLQTGIKSFGDVTEQAEWFLDIVDEEDWKQVDAKVLNDFDLYQMQVLFDRYNNNVIPDPMACGIYTLSILDAFLK